MPLLDPDRLFPAEPRARGLARALHAEVASLPLVCPHGHVDPQWFAADEPFADPVALFLLPDHYLLRMLVSQGVGLDALGVPRRGAAPGQGAGAGPEPRAVWRLLAAHWHLFLATPSRLWLEHVFETLFGIEAPLSPTTADEQFDRIAAAIATPAFRPRALYERFGIEVLATTDAALDGLAAHRAIAASGWGGRVIPTYRPDAVTDPEAPGFAAALDRLGALTGEDTGRWAGYLAAHRARRAHFRAHGATATDHGAPSAMTLDLPAAEAAALFDRIRRGAAGPGEAAAFRAQMLTEFARMSCEDGMVMQLHPGSLRNHSAAVFAGWGPDRGFDIPVAAEYTVALKPLLDAVGHHPRLTLIVFTLDEASLSRELAPLAGAYPCLRLGPAWWFHDSPAGMRRFRELTTETAGFFNTVGFNDDTRALPSIPARHDMARRVDCAFLAELVVAGRLPEAEAPRLARALAVDLARAAYRL
ncbi:MAG: glucuronate isomerase [Rhodobacteraceae bacterium]|jgi:glucuronate isomerase|nr:glucuronate isomerase [Paracoccaceae bacterium]